MRAEDWFVPPVQNSVKWHTKGRTTISNTPRKPLLAATPEVHCLDVLRIVVSSRPSHSSWINVIGHDIAIVRERHLTDGALPVLLDNLAVEQLPHLCFGAEFAISPGVGAGLRYVAPLGV